jgi:hypothetical protein
MANPIIIDDDVATPLAAEPSMKSEDAFLYYQTTGKHPRDFRFRTVPYPPGKEPNGEVVTDLVTWRNSRILLTAVHLCAASNPGLLRLTAKDSELFARWYGLQQQHEQASYCFTWLYVRLIGIHRTHKDEPTWDELLRAAVREIYTTWSIDLGEDEDEEAAGH